MKNIQNNQAKAINNNAIFLRNIYKKGPFQGHAFCVTPPAVPFHELPYGDYTVSDKPVSEWIGWVADFYERSVRWQEEIGDDSVPVARIVTGTHIYAAAFGAEVKKPSNNNPYSIPFINSPQDADRVVEPDIWKSPTLYRVFELAEQIRKELGPDIPISLPDVQSGFDTAAIIWSKEDFFCSMVLAPDSVKRLAGKCARLLKQFLTEFKKEFPNTSNCHCPSVWAPPEMGPWLSNDECGAMNTQHFEEFCLPELIDLAETFGSLGMHCCADAEHQFESFLKIPNFYAFNRVAGKRGYDPILEYFDGKGSPVFVLFYVEDEDIEKLIKNAPEGMRFIFNLVETEMEEAKAWFQKCRALSPREDKKQ